MPAESPRPPMTAPVSSALAPGAIDAQHPWLGLASFTEDTRAYFHGRDDEVGELGRRVQRKLLTILFGQSGLGKTSILRAGLVPRLRPEGYCPVYVRLDYGRESPPPAEQIKLAIYRATEAAGHWTRAGIATAGESLWEFLHHRDDVLRDAEGRTLVPLLIFDQFEEIFTLAQGDDHGRQRAAEFIEELADLVENRAPRALEARLEADEAGLEKYDFSRSDYRILIALREDYLAHLEGLRARMPSVTQNRMRLARMTGAQALAAVTGPGGSLVNDEVAAAIVRFVAGGAEVERAEVEPSLLSLVCRELNNTRLAQGEATISTALLAGSRDTILSEFYERTLADQPAGVRAFLEDELLTDSGYRESIAEERVRKGLAAAGAAENTLALLIDRRLLRVEERLDVRRVELTHDVLCGVVKASRTLRHEREALEQAGRELEAQREREAATRRSLNRARLAAAVAGVLMLGAAGSAVFGWVNLRRAAAAEIRASRERDRAQQSRAEAEKLVSFLLDDLYTELEPTGKIEIVSGLARRALAYFSALPPEFHDARSERFRAIALSRLGLSLSQQGKTLEAEDPLREAEELFRRLADQGDRSPETIVGHTAVVRQQSRNAYLQNRAGLSVELGRRAVTLVQPAAAAAGAPAFIRLEHGRSTMNYGFILLRERQHAESIEALRQALGIFEKLRDEPQHRQRARVQYAEACAWLSEALRRNGQVADAVEILRAAVPIANEAVEAEAGNLGALRSRALLRSRQAQAAMDDFQYREAEKLALATAADWTEFLRFDAANDTARNNRRVARGVAAAAQWRIGEFESAIRLSRENAREIIAAGGSPSTVRGAAFQTEVLDAIEADLGRVTDVDAAIAEGNRMRALAVAQVDPENYFRFVTPLWNENQRSELLLRTGRPDEALTVARSVAGKFRTLNPVAGSEKETHRYLLEGNARVQTEALLRLRRWAEAAQAARDLVRGRPALGDTSPGTLDDLATDRAIAAVALARHGDKAEARELLSAAARSNRERRAAGADDHASRTQTAWIALGEGLLAATPAEQRRWFAQGISEVNGMAPQPQRLRSVRELRETLEAELARVAP
ncbi:MAG: hypothetical protein HZC55_15010 [Verrucomicrobia bacterium]|nr:hypothetical protein [Verrucomicrobiota bacterium]